MDLDGKFYCQNGSTFIYCVTCYNQPACGLFWWASIAPRQACEQLPSKITSQVRLFKDNGPSFDWLALANQIWFRRSWHNSKTRKLKADNQVMECGRSCDNCSAHENQHQFIRKYIYNGNEARIEDWPWVGILWYAQRGKFSELMFPSLQTLTFHKRLTHPYRDLNQIFVTHSVESSPSTRFSLIHRCTLTLLSDRWAITAAHCFFAQHRNDTDRYVDPWNFLVELGVEKRQPHPPAFEYDIRVDWRVIQLNCVWYLFIPDLILMMTHMQRWVKWAPKVRKKFVSFWPPPRSHSD